MTDPATLRKRVVAWSDHTRELHRRALEAGESRQQAMYAAIEAGLSWQLVARDAGIAPTTLNRMLNDYCRRTGKPWPNNRKNAPDRTISPVMARVLTASIDGPIKAKTTNKNDPGAHRAGTIKALMRRGLLRQIQIKPEGWRYQLTLKGRNTIDAWRETHQ